MKIDPSLFNRDDVEKDLPEHSIPPVVIAAIAVFSLIFLGGGIYLLISGPFLGINHIEPHQLPPVLVAVKPYDGTLWQVEGERKKMQRQLKEDGLALGPAINIFKTSPGRMRPLNVSMEIGFILKIGLRPNMEFEEIVIKEINPGRRLLVLIDGQGNFTGSKAYKAAQEILGPKGLSPAEGERYEIKIIDEAQQRKIEHWIPVN